MLYIFYNHYLAASLLKKTNLGEFKFPCPVSPGNQTQALCEIFHIKTGHKLVYLVILQALLQGIFITLLQL